LVAIHDPSPPSVRAVVDVPTACAWLEVSTDSMSRFSSFNMFFAGTFNSQLLHVLHAVQTISSSRRMSGARGQIIVETHCLVVAPSAEPLPSAAWLKIALVFTLGVPLSSPDLHYLLTQLGGRNYPSSRLDRRSQICDQPCQQLPATH